MTAAVAAPPRPEAVWKALAPLLSAPGRSSVRVFDPDTGRFSGVARLTVSLPTRPTATYLYTRAGRTHVLALDFDCSRGDRAAVEADLATAAEWITRCGGVTVTDRSPGGAHLYCPLAIGTTATVEEITHLVGLLAARLPTLDKTPNTNADTGCLSAPGTPAKQGGYRQLDGPLAAAVEAFTTRSAPALLPRLYELLGAVTARSRAAEPATGTSCSGPDDFCEGQGAERRLAPVWVRADPLDPDITAYARHGTLPAGQRQWESASEARMAVITAAVARGHSPASIAALAAPGGPWQHGLGTSYSEHYTNPAAIPAAINRDFKKSLTWLCTHVLEHRRRQHKIKNSQGGHPGGSGPCGPATLRRWLAAALLWADGEYQGRRVRWTVHAVLHTLAWHAHTAGEYLNGTWVVGVGGRNLSLGTGLLSHDAVFRVLRDLQDRPGAPLILTRPHVGVDADHYALTRPAGITADREALERVRIEPLHDAWSVLGHHLRRIYDLVAHHGVTTRAELYAAARVSAGAGDEAVTALQIAGLLTRPARGAVTLGPVTLDTIAAAHDTDSRRQQRITRYRAERQQWRTWLAENLHRCLSTAALATAHHPRAHDEDADRSFWTTVMDHGPPPPDQNAGRPPDQDHTPTDEQALDVALATLGGRILCT